MHTLLSKVTNNTKLRFLLHKLCFKQDYFKYTQKNGINISTINGNFFHFLSILHVECSSWYNRVGDFWVSICDRRKQLLYTDGSACMAWQINPTPPECVVNGTECFDSWMWAIYLFVHQHEFSTKYQRAFSTQTSAIWQYKQCKWVSTKYINMHLVFTQIS